MAHKCIIWPAAIMCINGHATCAIWPGPNAVACGPAIGLAYSQASCPMAYGMAAYGLWGPHVAHGPLRPKGLWPSYIVLFIFVTGLRPIAYGYVWRGLRPQVIYRPA